MARTRAGGEDVPTSQSQSRLFFPSTVPTRPGDPNRQARSSLAQRELARSTGGDRPSQWHRYEARGRCSHDGVLPQSVPGTTKHTGSGLTHTHEHRSQLREALVAQPGSRGRTGRRNCDGGTKAARKCTGPQWAINTTQNLVYQSPWCVWTRRACKAARQ
jgi:hypothetical protein